MGACDFYTIAKGSTAREAFNAAVSEAQYEYGHGGYTGSIAEKTSFTMIELPMGVTPMRHAQDLIEIGDPRIDEKWGPAGCIRISEGKYLFFGWASE